MQLYIHAGFKKVLKAQVKKMLCFDYGALN